MSEFFHMGGYALYVWTSYGLALVILVANLVWPLRRRKKQLALIKRRLRQAPAGR